LAIAPAAHAATGVVISQVAFGGTGGGNDEVVEIRNTTAATIDISTWELWGSNMAGTASARATVPAGTTLPAGRTFVFANSLGTFTAAADVIYTTGITNTGGIQIRDAGGAIRDRFGSTSVPEAYREGLGLAQPSSGPGGFIRKSGGTQDTDVNENDFTGPTTPTPTRCGEACSGPVGPQPCDPGADGIVPITSIQTLGAGSACEGKTVTVKGIVTGIDDLYGSNFSTVFKADSGIWIQEASPDPQATTSSALFVAGIKRDHDPATPAGPADIIGAEVKITGKVETKFGQVGIVPAGVGNTGSGTAQEVDLKPPVGEILSTGNALPEPKTIDRAKAEAQDLDRTYYRSLQGMRVKLTEGIATGGGTTKFNDVFVEPGTTAERLLRKDSPLASNTPWHDKPAELGIAPDGGAGNPGDPRLPWKSATQVNLDLFDVAGNVVGPLSFGFSYYKIMPQLVGAPAPAITRGPINAAAPPTAPAQPADTLRVASFNVENYFPVGKENDGHVITQDEYNERTDAIVKAIKDRLGAPDVVAVQEVAVFADGANALTGLAQALGNYTGYITTNNDGRGIATGFLVKAGTTATNGRLLRSTELGNWSGESVCDLYQADGPDPGTEQDGKLFDRAPYALDLKKGDVSFTALSNHFASQSHQTKCRVDEADAVRQEAAAMQQAGKNVLVAGDLNDFEFSLPLATLTQGNVLANLWYDVPAGQAYSYKFNGHLQTLDHILVTAGLKTRLTDVRYIHLDNDVYERVPNNGTGISDHDPPLATFTLGARTSTPGDVTGNVPATLALTLGPPATFGDFTPGMTKDYTAGTTATVTSTGADATLSVLDASSNATGRLTNGSFALADQLQATANNGTFASLRSDNGPLTLVTWDKPISAATVALGFKQHISASEGLRTGAYSKTLTFTLSTTAP
jgi:predicted extracellular nuclease